MDLFVVYLHYSKTSDASALWVEPAVLDRKNHQKEE